MAALVKVPPHTLPGYDENGPWFYNAISGLTEHATGPAATTLIIETRLAGDWYGFKTQADVNNAVSVEGWPKPTTSILGAAGNAAGKAAGNIVGGWTFQGTGFSGWFLRGLKIVLGGALIVIGLAHLTGTDDVIADAAKSAANAAVKGAVTSATA